MIIWQAIRGITGATLYGVGQALNLRIVWTRGNLIMGRPKNDQSPLFS